VPAHLSVKPEASTVSTITLRLDPPLDDGGLPVQRYLIWKRHPEEGFRDGYSLAGTHTFNSPRSHASPYSLRPVA
jgi:hypothetical protein